MTKGEFVQNLRDKFESWQDLELIDEAVDATLQWAREETQLEKSPIPCQDETLSECKCKHCGWNAARIYNLESWDQLLAEGGEDEV
jgi:hypothetical protein